MKEIFSIDDTPANRISYFLLVVFLASLPLDRFYSELALIGLLLHTLIHPSLERRLTLHWSGWLIVLVYLSTVAGSLYGKYPAQAWNECGKQLGLLIFPLICYFTKLDLQKYKLRLLKVLGFSCFFTVIYLYQEAFVSIRIRQLPFSALFTPMYLNHAFAAPIDLHATYFSMYIGLSMVTFAWLTIRSSGIWAKTGYMLIFFVLFAAILQLASRAVFIAVMVVLNILMPFLLMSPGHRIKYFIAAIGITCICIGLVFHNDSLRQRYVVELRQDLNGVPGDINGPEPRIARWECAWELIRSSPWVGYGSGDEGPVLKARYYDHHLYDSYANELNAHNQYLSCWLRTGIFGLLIYLALLGVGFVRAIQSKDLFFCAFLVIITLVSFSENILGVNKGIFFVSFFFSFFFSMQRSHNAKGVAEGPTLEVYRRHVFS
jgi:O-antigen ligase